MVDTKAYFVVLDNDSGDDSDDLGRDLDTAKPDRNLFVRQNQGNHELAIV
jgi:hypothetical protein